MAAGKDPVDLDIKAAILCFGEIFSNEALHFDVCRPYQKESMTFNNMGKDIKGMESPVSYKQRDTGWRRVVSVYKGT